VGQLGTLGRPGRARGVEDHGGVRGVAIRHLGERGDASQHLLELAWSDDQAFGPGLGRPQLCLLRGPVPRGEDLGLRVSEQEGDLAPLEQDVHR
jgi:hypothetical protein